MSKMLETRLCPIMSRAVTFPIHELNDDGGHIERFREDHLIEIECRQDECAWYIENEGECALKWQALMVMGMYMREDDS